MARWEAGGQPNDDYRDLLCRLFQTGPVALGFGHDYTPEAEPAVASEPQAPVAPAQRGGPSDRRHALKLGGQATLGAAVGTGLSDVIMDAAADAMEFTRRAEASSVGPHTLEHLELAIAGMAASFAHTPPAELFPKARWYRQKVAHLIDSQHTLRQGRNLYRCAGWFSIVLGWLSHDLGDAVAADAYCLDAWEHGWQAEDGAICAWAMDAQASIAMYNHRPAVARDAALKGLSRAPEGSAAATRITAQLARTYARIGRLDLGLAYVELGAPDDAAQEVRTALASERLTGSVVSHLGDLATTMNRKYPQLDVTRAVHNHSLVLAGNFSRPALPSA